MEEEKATSTSTTITSNPAKDMETKLFELRLKINQGRKANRAEAEEEWKRLSNRNRKNKKKEEEEVTKEDDEDFEEDKTADDKEKKDKKKKETTKKGEKDPAEMLLNQTAADAEWLAGKRERKEEIASTYGLSAFTSDAYFRAYDKRVSKLVNPNAATQHQEKEGVKSALELNPFDYGKVNTSTSDEAKERLKNDILEREDQRKKFSRRRMFTDTGDVDYINDKNAHFNKKLKRSFDKYTLEIRQNLERGTAI